MHRLGAADQHRLAIAEIAVLDRRAQHDLVFRLGEDHALGMGLHLLIDLREHRSRRVEPGFQAVAIGVEILDRLLRHARIHRRLGDGRRDDFHQAGIERRGDDVFTPELVVLAVSGGDFLGHLLARQLGDGLGGGDLHLLVDRGRAHVERAAEDERKAQHIVDLVGIVRTAGGDDGIASYGHGVGRSDLWVRIGHGEDDRVLGHRLDHVLAHRARDRQAEEDIRADNRFGQRALVGFGGMGRLELVDALAALPDHTLAVAHDDILMPHAHGFDQAGAGNRRSPRAVDHDLDVFELAPGDQAGVDQARRRNDRGAVLVVVHHRDFHPLAQGLLDDEAFGGLDVLKVNAAEAGLHHRDGLDQGFGVFAGQFDVDRIDVGEALEQHCLAFHHRLGGERTEIAHAEDRGAIGDHRDKIALGGVIVGAGRIVVDRLHRHGDAWRIGQRKVALRRHRLGGDDLDLTGANGLVVKQGLAVGETDVAFVGQVKSPGIDWPLTQGAARG